MAVSDVESQPVIPVDGSPHLSTSREYQKDSARPGPAAASLCGALPVQMPRSVGTRKHRILMLQIKKPTSFNSFNLDSPTNSKEALEGLLDYTEKGKMLKKRVLTQSWVRKAAWAPSLCILLVTDGPREDWLSQLRDGYCVNIKRSFIDV